MCLPSAFKECAMDGEYGGDDIRPLCPGGRGLLSLDVTFPDNCMILGGSV